MLVKRRCQVHLMMMNSHDSTGERPRQPLERLVPNPKLKLLDQVQEVMRLKQLARRSEETYIQWIRRFILFHRKPAAVTDAPLQKWIWRHPTSIGRNRKVAATVRMLTRASTLVYSRMKKVPLERENPAG